MSLIKTTTTLIIFCLFLTTLAYAQTAEDYFNLGYAKSGLKDYKGAIQDLNKAIELNPKFADAYINRGIAKITSGQKDDGCLDLSKAGELGYAEAYEAIKEYCN